MKTKNVLGVGALAVALVLTTSCRSPDTSTAGTTSYGSHETSLSLDSRAALTKVTGDVPAAATLARDAKGILVFPGVVKAGFIVGAWRGEGTLFKGGKTTGYYSTTGASYGLQAGIQTYGYALFFMTDAALRYLDNTEGFEIGVGPSIVILDEGAAKNLTTTTGRSDIYGFVFDQKGLMAGLGLQGSKINKINP
jgi:lipid-binding SYLF domain-containing protein